LWELNLGRKDKVVAPHNVQEGVIPRWFVNLPNFFFKRVSRLARRRNVSEEELLLRALELVQKDKLGIDAGARMEENDIWLRSISRRVSEKKAREILGELMAHFGALTKLTERQRSARAKKAAQARWKGTVRKRQSGD
jgi:hypothetical protein